MEDSVEFVYKGDGEVHWKDRMGVYVKTKKMNQGFPVFEQVNENKEGEERYYLHVGLEGRWRVSTSLGDTDTHTSVLKNISKDPTPELPPKTGWCHRENQEEYDNDYKWTWVEDESIETTIKIKDDEPSPPSILTRLPYCSATLNTNFMMSCAAFQAPLNSNQLICTGAGPNVDIWDLRNPPTNISPSSRLYAKPAFQLNMDGGIPEPEKTNISDITNWTVKSLALHDTCLLVGGGFKDMMKPIQVIVLGHGCPTFEKEMGDFNKSCSQVIASSDGKQCYSVYDEARSIDLWDIHNGAHVGQLEGHTDYIYKIQQSGEANHVWSKGADSTVRVWDLRTFGQVNQYEVKGSMACNPKQDSVLAITGEHQLSVLHGNKSDVEEYELEGGVDLIGYSRVDFANSGKWIMMTGNDGQHGYTAPSDSEPCSWMFTIDQEYSRTVGDCYDGPWAISKDDGCMVMGKVNNSGGHLRFYAEVYKIDY